MPSLSESDICRFSCWAWLSFQHLSPRLFFSYWRNRWGRYRALEPAKMLVNSQKLHCSNQPNAAALSRRGRRTCLSEKWTSGSRAFLRAPLSSRVSHDCHVMALWIIDSQGSGVIMEGNLHVSEAEGYLGRDLASEQMDRDLLVAEVMTAAKRIAPKRQIYHWDIVGSRMQ